MGAYGSPELGPYYDNNGIINNEKQGEKDKVVENIGLLSLGYVSKFEFVLHIILIFLFVLFFIAGGGNKNSFFVTLFMTSLISFVSHITATIICRFKMVKNNLYKLKIIEAIILCIISLFFLGA